MYYWENHFVFSEIRSHRYHEAKIVPTENPVLEQSIIQAVSYNRIISVSINQPTLPSAMPWKRCQLSQNRRYTSLILISFDLLFAWVCDSMEVNLVNKKSLWAIPLYDDTPIWAFWYSRWPRTTYYTHTNFLWTWTAYIYRRDSDIWHMLITIKEIPNNYTQQLHPQQLPHTDGGQRFKLEPYPCAAWWFYTRHPAQSLSAWLKFQSTSWILLEVPMPEDDMSED